MKPIKKRRYWTEDEIKFLLSNASTMPLSEIAEALDRTVCSVHEYLLKYPAVYRQRTHRHSKRKQSFLHSMDWCFIYNQPIGPTNRVFGPLLSKQEY